MGGGGGVQFLQWEGSGGTQTLTFTNTKIVHMCVSKYLNTNIKKNKKSWGFNLFLKNIIALKLKF